MNAASATRDEILLLAFGKDAAAEMAERIKERAGVDLDALTFHALGNRIIREVEGKGPTLADHASDDAKFRVLLRDILLNEVASKAGLGQLILDWLSEFYWPYKSEWDFKTQDNYFQWVEAHELRTLNGDLVRSFEEWEISNWLHRNGIAFEYRRNGVALLDFMLARRRRMWRRMEGEIGALVPGSYADLLVVDGGPPLEASSGRNHARRPVLQERAPLSET